MRVLAYRGPKSLVVEERPTPEAAAGEVVVRVDACSICGTDQRIFAGAHRAFAEPTGKVPGHEIVGTVVEAGTGTQAREGVRVFVAPNYGCGHCRGCLRGDVNLCETPRAIGITEDGGFAEFLRLPRELVEQGNLLPVADGFDAGAAAIAEPLACALRGSRACRIGSGDTVIVFGAGPIGLFHIALARIAGAAEILVCEPNKDRRDRALTWGASAAYATDAELPGGADVAIVAAAVPAAQQRALELTGTGGRVNFFAGLPRDRSRVELDTNLIHYKELMVTGTTASTNVECRDALNLILSGAVDTASMIGGRYALASSGEAFDLAASGNALKVVIEP
ncbi:alcohol dehydrogenase catalytic domain-containing protein [Kribbella sp. NPDC050820]|uniref:alcohol dehydrogenase catalytic domain-containing protein n=1 Tax=Kribbella sp. NPDC050820 TaxID=3155408 RepID=UPI0033E463AA